MNVSFLPIPAFEILNNISQIYNSENKPPV